MTSRSGAVGVGAVPDFSRLPDTIAQEVAQAMGAGCILRLCTPSGDPTELGAVGHSLPPGAEGLVVAVGKLAPTRFRLLALATSGEGIVRAAFASGESSSACSREEARLLRASAVRAVLAAPVKARDRHLGTLVLVRFAPEDAPFDLDEEHRLTHLAEWAALSLDNSLLLDQLQTTEAELREVQLTVSRRFARRELVAQAAVAFDDRALDEPSLIDELARRAAVAIGDLAIVRLFESENCGGRTERIAAHHVDPTLDSLTQKAFESVADRLPPPDAAVLTWPRAPSVLAMQIPPERVRKWLRRSYRDRPELAGAKAALVAPLPARDHILGSLIVCRPENSGRPYSPDDASLLRRLADRAAVTLDHARLFAEAGQHARRKTALVEVGRWALEGLQLDALYEIVVALAADTLGVEYAEAAEAVEGETRLHIAAAVGWPERPDRDDAILGVLGPLLRFTMAASKTATVEDLAADPRFEPPPSPHRPPFMASLSTYVPGGQDADAAGVLAVHSVGRRAFSDSDVAFLQGLANVLGMATERERSSRALRQREAEMRAMVEEAPELIVRWDSDLRHLYVNPAAERAQGIPAEQLIGHTNRELGLPEELVASLEFALRQVFRTGRESSVAFTTPRADGDRRYEARLVPQTAEDGSVRSVLSIARDVTDRSRAEVGLAALSKELQERDARLQKLIGNALAERDQEKQQAAAGALVGLSAREQEVLRLLAAGRSNKEIGQILSVAPGTVKNHVARLLPKLGVADRTQAAVLAERLGLLSTPQAGSPAGR